MSEFFVFDQLFNVFKDDIYMLVTNNSFEHLKKKREKKCIIWVSDEIKLNDIVVQELLLHFCFMFI
jgi:hypothetical protein